MKKFYIFLIIAVFSLNICAFADLENKTDNTIVKNRLFALEIPAKLKGTYVIQKSKDRISVYDKEAKKANFGGFAFGIKAYKNPADYAEMPGAKKLGELSDKKGTLYDIILKHPTDVQCDYTKGSEATESFKLLYNLGEDIKISGRKGSTYYKNQGMKGENLYGEVLQKHLTAVKEKWNSSKLEKEDMSYMYNIIPKDKIGYTYYDVNLDGIDELLIGEIADGSWKGVIYDIYTMVDRKPKHAVSGGSRNRYFVCDDAFICREYSGGANESGVNVYILVQNSTELFPQVSFKYDGYKNPKNPYFLSYGNGEDDDKWENVSEKKYRERKKIFERYQRFNYLPLTKYSKKNNF